MGTRETWLEKAIIELNTGLFQRHGETIPKVRVSVGFPGGKSPTKVIGQYWKSIACNDAIPQVFISPVIEQSTTALEILCHELVHACFPDAGHKGPFKQLAKSIGLQGKMTATKAGPTLTQYLEIVSKKLGIYPHSAINFKDRKKQTTRLIKVECIGCGFTIRVARKWLLEPGPPICQCNQEKMKITG